MHAFQYQESGQTLAEGIAEYSTANELVRSSEMSPQAREFFRCHDAAHVVFGCNVTLDDEAVVKVASILGTTAGFHVLRGYLLHESRQIYLQLRLSEVLLSVLRSAVIVPRTAFRCFTQRARWPWSEHQKYLHSPLGELRREFGIKVAHSPSGKANGA